MASREPSGVRRPALAQIPSAGDYPAETAAEVEIEWRAEMKDIVFFNETCILTHENLASITMFMEAGIAREVARSRQKHSLEDVNFIRAALGLPPVTLQEGRKNWKVE